MSAPGALSEAEVRFDALRRKIGLVGAPVVFVGLLLLPMPGLSTEAHRLAAVASMTVVLWITEAIPLAAAALLGPALAALLGVADARVALAAFADPLMFLFMGGFLFAGAMSRQGFDRRAALWLVSRRIVAGSPVRALVAMAGIAFAFSMWLSNTATIAMLIPVALGLHATMKDALEDDPEERRRLDRFSGGMCLTMAYAASIGGMTTPIGTAPNVIAMGMLETEVGLRLDFVEWMSFAVPTALVVLGILIVLAVRRFSPLAPRMTGVTAVVQRQLAEIGPMRPGERRVVGLFGLAVLGWLTPSIAKLTLGPEHPWTMWAREHLVEGIVAMVAASVLFFLPSGSREGDADDRRLLGWKNAQEIDWGTMFLLGGGLALGRLTFDTGLADALGRGVLGFAGPIVSHPLGLAGASALLVVVLTEVTSNTATTAMMLPVLIGVAKAGHLDPGPTAIATTLAASLAFMLPVSTPPNAMAYGTRLVRLDTMVSFGVRLDLLGLVVLMGLVALLPWWL